MTKPKLLAMCLCVAALACGKGDESKPAAGGSPKAAGAEQGGAVAPAKPFSGKLTGDVIMSAKGLVALMEPWAKAEPKLLGQLGKPTHQEGADLAWAVVEGDSCFEIFVSKGNEKELFPDKTDAVDIVASLQEPKQWEKASAPSGNWDACLEHAGVEQKPTFEGKLTAEQVAELDPTAVLSPAQIASAVIEAKVAWVGKEVSLKGIYRGTSKTGTADAPIWIVSVASPKEEGGHSVGCRFAADPGTFLGGTEISVKGTVQEDGFPGDLAECAVVAGEKLGK